jgi:hypothetical protein
MTTQDEMKNDIEYWLEHCGYADVVNALIDACQFWATTETHDLLHHTMSITWAARARDLRQLLCADHWDRKETP